jgi:putative ABC transport system permease protein
LYGHLKKFKIFSNTYAYEKTYTMFRSYFKTAYRQLVRNKFYSAINMLGLGIGLASCFLILVYVQDELSYDRFHEKGNRIYRIAERFKTGEGEMTTGLTPYRLALDLKDQFPEIENVVRIDYDIESEIVQYGDKEILQNTITAVDPQFFDVFSFKLLQGNPKTALMEPNTVVISDAKARLYFPNGNAMGKVLNFKNPYSHDTYMAKVTGVFKEMPRNSHFHKDFLLSAATADALIQNRKDDMGWTSHFSYLLLHPSTDPDALEKRINEYIFSHYPKKFTGWWSYFPLQALPDIHLHSNLKEELEPNGDITYLYIFSAIALIILLLACINYMNLATARAATRAKEIGVRKVVGAFKRQLVFQLIGESVLLTMLAFVIACILSSLFLPLFNFFAGKELQIDFSNAGLLAIFLALSFIIGIIAGIYPAFFLSAFNPIKVLKGAVPNVGVRSLLFRRGLVVLQFAISIALIVGTVIIYRQWGYLQQKKLGISSEQVVVVPVQTRKEDFGYPVLKKELLRNTNIVHVTAVEKDITSRFGNYSTLTVNGKKVVMPRAEVDPDFFKTFGVPLMAGAGFKQEPDPENAVNDYILNEAALELIGMQDPVGKLIDINETKGRIIGVVKNFHLESLHSEISPVLFSARPLGFNYFIIKIKPENIKGSIAYIEKQYKKIDPQAVFQYSFLDDNIDALYKTEAKFFTVFTTFSAMAIFIACMGILGLASFAAHQRTKEIGIRKVLGASVRSIAVHLTADFIKLVLLSNIIAWPVAFYFMYQWLERFPYHIEIDFWIFVLAGMAALFIAVLTVSFQSIKAAVANPVKSLRTE